MNINDFKTSKMTVVAFLLIGTIIFGNFAIVEKFFLGVVPTYYRVIIPIMFFLFFLKKNSSGLSKEKTTKSVDIVNVFYFVIVIWLIYGIISLILSPWTVFNDGLKELMCITLGLFSVYIIIELCERGQFKYMIVALKITICISLIIGYIEVFTGVHLSTSMLSDPMYLERLQQLYPQRNYSESFKYIATGFFYNPNDYCAFLSIFAPVLLYFDNFSSAVLKFMNYFSLALISMMLLIDDAIICIIALIISLLFYLIFDKAPIKRWVIIAVAFFSPRVIGNSVIWFITSIINKVTGNTIVIHDVDMSNVELAVAVQTENMAQETGSLFLRINTYVESIKEMFLNSKGLGLGAGSFSNFFGQISEDKNMMSNPHSLWIEILAQYGIIIFSMVVIVLIVIFIRLVLENKKHKNNGVILVMAMGISFIFASFAPSSFLKGTYYWILFGLALGLLSSTNCTNSIRGVIKSEK
ncbi:MAG: hypothetical protein Q4C46_00880 [Bacillota bacterium]|nr:hypothetical protein [Bacillota bacterium]